MGKYQTISLNEYVNHLDKEEKKEYEKVTRLQTSLTKFLSDEHKAKINADILEELLA